MELEKEYILTITRCGSFSKAAEALHMTQPALSIAIRKVETRLGMPLFNRKKHPLQLTEAGAVYVRGLREIKKVEETVDQQLKDLADLVTGNLRIGGSHYLNAHILPPPADPVQCSLSRHPDRFAGKQLRPSGFSAQRTGTGSDLQLQSGIHTGFQTLQHIP